MKKVNKNKFKLNRYIKIESIKATEKNRPEINSHIWYSIQADSANKDKKSNRANQ